MTEHAFPTKHSGFIKKRIWVKVKWIRDPPGEHITGKFDLLPREIADEYHEFLEIKETIQTESCERGLSIGFGKQEKEVDAWIQRHKL